MKKIISYILTLMLAFTFAIPNANAATKQLEVHFINVGQGDAILIKAPNGKNMLVDGGPSSSGKQLVSYLKGQKIKKLDYVVATHPDADHIGGLINVLNSISIGKFIDSGKIHTSQTFEKMIKLISDKKIPYIVPKTGDKIVLDSTLKMDVLHANEKTEESNEASIVLKLTYNKVSFLLMGDADTNIENELMKTSNVKATVLKAGHHGSNTSSSAKFISTVKPATAILSYGKDNKYGHPHAAVQSRLKKVGAKVYETAKHCNIVVKTDGLKHTVSTGCGNGNKVTTVTKPSQVKPTTSTTQTKFKNCTELRKVYPKGVAKGHPAYQLKLDRDKDGWACEL